MMDLFKEYFLNAFHNGILGISLNNWLIIISLFIIALLIRGLFAKIFVIKIKKLIKKSVNQIDDKLFESLIPPLRFFLNGQQSSAEHLE